MISSPQNEKVRLVRHLLSGAKQRRKEQRIVLEGARLILDAVQAGQQPDFVLYVPDVADADRVSRLAQNGVVLAAVSADVMRLASDTQQPQGLVGVFALPTGKVPDAAERILVLDGVRDPGNLGTLLRTAAASGVEGVLLSPDCADLYNPKVLRAGMGAHFRVPVQEADWDSIGSNCSRLNVYAADTDGELRYDRADWSHPWALIIGSEAHGLSTAAENLVRTRVFIPMSAATESLNAATAAAVILFEAQRQRLVASGSHLPV